MESQARWQTVRRAAFVTAGLIMSALLGGCFLQEGWIQLQRAEIHRLIAQGERTRDKAQEQALREQFASLQEDIWQGRDLQRELIPTYWAVFAVALLLFILGHVADRKCEALSAAAQDQLARQPDTAVTSQSGPSGESRTDSPAGDLK